MFSLVLLHLTVAALASSVTYDDLRLLNATCDGLDTCRDRDSNDDLRQVNCQCGPSCARFGTCCLDAPNYTGGVRYGGDMGCVAPYGNHRAVFMVDKCPNDWEGDDSVRELCVGDGQARSDLMLLVPVSSQRTGITYRNYFCFICNSVDDPDDEVIPWDISLRLSHNRSRDIDLSTLTFNTWTSKWTYPGAPRNSILGLSTERPGKLPEKSLVYCHPRLITSCAANWTEPDTRAKCESYTALVTMLGKDLFTLYAYRNVHCGICNFLKPSFITCFDHYTTPRDLVEAFRPAVSKDPTHVAAKVYKELFWISEDPCPPGQIWDFIAKKCRNLHCGLKMEKVNGRCVRKTE